MNAGSVPVVVVALLLASAAGAGTAQVVLDGDQTASGVEGVLVAAGGTTTVPADETVGGPVYVAGGDVVVAGSVDGDVVVLQGSLAVADGGSVTGTVEEYGGVTTVATGGSVGSRERVPVSPGENTAPVYQFAVVEAAAFAVLGFLVGGRLEAALARVGRTAADHPVVSVTVGGLVGVTGIAVAVFMAFTLVLLPVAVLGLVGVAAVAAYGVVALGSVAGRRLPLASVRRQTAVGAAAVAVALRVLGLLPVVGGLAALTVVAAGFGAALVTYLGTADFEPATIPPLRGE